MQDGGKAEAATWLLVGAGAAQDRPRLSGAQRVLIVEPAADRAEALRRDWADVPGCEVQAVGLGAADGSGRLHVMNAPAFNSLHAPLPALTGLFPGLRTLAAQEVRVVTPATLLAGRAPWPMPFGIRIDAPGSEMDILRGLEEAGVLDGCPALRLRCAEAPCHEGATGRAGLAQWLADRGLACTAVDDSDPDWPVLSFSAEGQREEAADLHRRIAALEAAAQVRDATLAEAAGRAARAEGRVAELEAAARVQGAAAQAAETGQRRLAADLQGAQAAQAAAIAERDRALALAESRRAALAERDEGLRAFEEMAQWRDDRIAALEAELAARDEAASRALEEARAREEQAAEAGRRIAALEAAAQARDAALAEAAGRAARAEGRVAELEAAARPSAREAELEHRLNLSRDDLRRAEGQIALITDLLLRGDLP